MVSVLPLQSHAHPWSLLRLTVSIGGHRPWDGVIFYRLFICQGVSFYIIITYQRMGQQFCYQLLSEKYLGRAHRVCHLCLIIEYYQLRQYLSRACSVYWQYIIISYYQRGVSWWSTQCLSLVPYYGVLSVEIVSQYIMGRLLVVPYYHLLSEQWLGIARRVHHWCRFTDIGS